jgi:hypothetical protein
MHQKPRFCFKKGLMACASNDILFSGGDTGSILPDIKKKPVLPKELTSKFGALKCDLCKVSVRILNFSLLRPVCCYCTARARFNPLMLNDFAQ